jgi:2,4-didehydro-3-deoxy-L-rhamnonate hydrolase
MRICRFNDGRLGVVEGAQIVDVSFALEELPICSYPLPNCDPLIAYLPDVIRRISKEMTGAPRFDVSSVRLLSPIANPGKIIAAPVNYQRHLAEARADEAIHHHSAVAEIQRVGLFLKATSSLVGAGQGVPLDFADRRNDHEIELAVIIGRSGRNIAVEEAMNHVAAYCIGLDMTLRGPEERSLRKSIDGYSVLGPWLVTADDISNPHALELSLSVSGELRQRANTRDLIMSIAELIVFASRFYTLHPGDVLFTGTPQGVGPVKPGDVMVATIAEIGSMEVAVRAARQAEQPETVADLSHE